MGVLPRLVIGKLIENKTNQPNSKIADLARRLWNSKLHLFATNLNTRSSEVYFRENHPNMFVTEAV